MAQKRFFFFKWCCLAIKIICLATNSGLFTLVARLIYIKVSIISWSCLNLPWCIWILEWAAILNFLFMVKAIIIGHPVGTTKFRSMRRKKRNGFCGSLPKNPKHSEEKRAESPEVDISEVSQVQEQTTTVPLLQFILYIFNNVLVEPKPEA